MPASCISMTALEPRLDINKQIVLGKEIGSGKNKGGIDLKLLIHILWEIKQTFKEHSVAQIRPASRRDRTHGQACQLAALPLPRRGVQRSKVRVLSATPLIFSI